MSERTPRTPYRESGVERRERQRWAHAGRRVQPIQITASPTNRGVQGRTLQHPQYVELRRSPPGPAVSPTSAFLLRAAYRLRSGSEVDLVFRPRPSSRAPSARPPPAVTPNRPRILGPRRHCLWKNGTICYPISYQSNRPHRRRTRMAWTRGRRDPRRNSPATRGRGGCWIGCARAGLTATSPARRGFRTESPPDRRRACQALRAGRRGCARRPADRAAGLRAQGRGRGAGQGRHPGDRPVHQGDRSARRLSDARPQGRAAAVARGRRAGRQGAGRPDWRGVEAEAAPARRPSEPSAAQEPVIEAEPSPPSVDPESPLAAEAPATAAEPAQPLAGPDGPIAPAAPALGAAEDAPGPVESLVAAAPPAAEARPSPPPAPAPVAPPFSRPNLSNFAFSNFSPFLRG